MRALTRDQILQRIEKTDSCWNWNGTLRPDGYGRLSYKSKGTVAHRVVYLLLVGDILPDMTLDHLCYNRKCVNPDHLEQVSLSENVKRGLARRYTSRWKTVRGKQIPSDTCFRGHTYSLVKWSSQRKVCKECHSIANAKRYLRLKEV